MGSSGINAEVKEAQRFFAEQKKKERTTEVVYDQMRRYRRDRKRVAKDLESARLAVEKLEGNLNRPRRWRARFNAADEMQAELIKLIEELRRKWNYCTFCGQRFKNKIDLQENCPGTIHD